jgi:hypothetical protein
MASKNPKMSKRDTAGKRKHAPVTAQELEIIRRLESGKNQRGYGFIQSWAVSCLWYKERERRNN